MAIEKTGDNAIPGLTDKELPKGDQDLNEHQRFEGFLS